MTKLEEALERTTKEDWEEIQEATIAELRATLEQVASSFRDDKKPILNARGSRMLDVKSRGYNEGVEHCIGLLRAFNVGLVRNP